MTLPLALPKPNGMTTNKFIVVNNIYVMTRSHEEQSEERLYARVYNCRVQGKTWRVIRERSFVNE